MPTLHTLHFQTSTQRGKKMTVDRGGGLAAAPSHGTTGTMDNSALVRVRVRVGVG